MIDIKKPHTMIVATNQAEFAYILSWCEMNDILPPWTGIREKFPIALNVNEGGWTDSMDRALDYVKFIDFIKEVTND